MTADASRKRRLELILRQIDALPTLPGVATRLLSLTASDDADAREVVELISSDQSLTARILALCRHADRGVREEVLTVQKAVVLLGFNAIRNAVLSVKVFEIFEPASVVATPGAAPAPVDQDAPGSAGARLGVAVLDPPLAARFDHVNFWRHSLAVAITAELLASAARAPRELPPSEAFVCGLLHDIGKLALDHALPKSFARVIELTDLNRGNIAEIERRVIGIDHHTAGKRLAEQWQLPHVLQDCIWLHGSACEALPRVPHRRMIGLVGLADLLVRQQHIGYSGNFVLKESPADLARKLGLEPAAVETVKADIYDELERRSRALGLDDRPSRELYMQSIAQANEVLGRLNGALDRRSRVAARQGQALEAITVFHAAAAPGQSVPDVMNAAVASAASVLGEGFFAVLSETPAAPGRPRSWLICQYGPDALPMRSQFIDPPPHALDLTALDAAEDATLTLMSIVPWIADYLLEAPDLRQVRMLPLRCGWGTAAVLLHDRAALPPWQQLQALTGTWGAAIAAAGQHDGARRLGEDLADANRALAEAQDRLLERESLARLGEMAAGAAHEMNNPLAVISGRSQLLASTLAPGSKEQKAAQTIAEQAHRLSDLITALRMFADPPRPQREPTDVALLLDAAVKRVQHARAAGDAAVTLQVRSKLPPLLLDPEQVEQAVSELIFNAVQAAPRTGVRVVAQAEPIERRLLVQVIDDGIGMDEHTLAHAMDPFFSAKKAGRRVGMGLPRAQQLAAAHGGRIDLRSESGQGTVATLTLPLDSAEGSADR